MPVVRSARVGRAVAPEAACPTRSSILKNCMVSIGAWEPLTEPPRQSIDSWGSAESNAAAWMRFWGFRDARVTQGGADAGVDVRSRGALAQVKFEAAQVGRPVLQRLVGARGRSVNQDLFFFSGVGFSAQAVEYANEMDIRLFKYSLTGAMTPENRSARAFLRTLPGVAEREAAEQARAVAERNALLRAAAQRKAVQRAAVERAAAKRLAEQRSLEERAAAQGRQRAVEGAEARAAQQRAATERTVVLARFAGALRAAEAKRTADEEAERRRQLPAIRRVMAGLVLSFATLCSWLAGSPSIKDVVRGGAALSYILIFWGLYTGLSLPPRKPGVRRFFIGLALLAAVICSWAFGGPAFRNLIAGDGITAAIVISILLMAWGIILA